MPAGLYRGLRRLDRESKHLLQMDPLLLQRNLALVDAGDIEQVFDETRHMLETAIHAGSDLVRGVGSLPFLQKLYAGGKRRDRVAQFVAEDGEEAVLLPMGALKGFRQSGEFIPLCRKLIALRDDLPPLVVEVEEHIGLGPQDIGLDRLLDEIDRSGFIATEAPRDARSAGGNKDDRDVTRPVVRAHDLGKFEAIHARHLDVEECEGIVMDQHELERFFAAFGGVEVEPVALEKRSQRKQVFFEIIDQQEPDRVVGWRHCAAVSCRKLEIWSSVMTLAVGHAASAAAGMVGTSALAGSSTIAVPPASPTAFSPAAPS